MIGPSQLKEIVGHAAAIGRLRAATTRGRLGSAYLLFGDPGIGKCTVATLWARLLHCSNPTGEATAGEPCGACPSCRQHAAGSHPDWFVLTGLIHDLGKVLCLFGEPQWAVVGDTFPVGCRYSAKIVYPEFFADNPDSLVPEYQAPTGVYSECCGLDNVHMSWGHDEYLYHIMKPYLPEPALYMIRYHSFYAAHRERDYEYLMTDHDRAMFDWVRAFNPYDLYSKSPHPPKLSELRPYYEGLLAKYLPGELRF